MFIDPLPRNGRLLIRLLQNNGRTRCFEVGTQQRVYTPQNFINKQQASLIIMQRTHLDILDILDIMECIYARSSTNFVTGELSSWQLLVCVRHSGGSGVNSGFYPYRIF
jgi:hypothetical protein